MSAPRKDRLEAHLAALQSPSSNEAVKRRAARWQHYAAVTGSAMALATNVAMPGLGAAITDSTATPEPVLRSVELAMAGRSSRLLANSAALNAVLTAQAAPTISTGGVVTLFSSGNVIQPGAWVSIYGTNLASGTAVWAGDFPTTLGGTSVTINGRPAYLSFVSPAQINLQAPDDMATGAVPVVVTTGAGAATSLVTLSPYAPAFELLPMFTIRNHRKKRRSRIGAGQTRQAVAF